MSSYPPPRGTIKFSSTCLDMLKKNCFVDIFSIFPKESFHGIKISTKTPFLLKYLIDLEKREGGVPVWPWKQAFPPLSLFQTEVGSWNLVCTLDEGLRMCRLGVSTFQLHYFHPFSRPKVGQLHVDNCIFGLKFKI